MSNLQDVLTLWENDRIFRSEFEKDPAKALQNAGVVLSENEFKKIEATVNLKKQIDLNIDLEKKVNK